MSAGAFLMRSATGIVTSHARSPRTIIATRQSYAEVIQRMSGEIIKMPAPPPAETIPTASPRLVVNHLVAVAESGVRNAPAANPTATPNVTWRCQSAVAWLDTTRPRPSSAPPAIVTARLPSRSDTAPQKNEPAPIAIQLVRASTDVTPPLQ